MSPFVRFSGLSRLWLFVHIVIRGNSEKKTCKLRLPLIAFPLNYIVYQLRA
jgi:hypothetical protein